MENVVGFEFSDTHTILLELLGKLGYTVNEWVLCPTQFGIPNRRPRYYLFATMGVNSIPSTLGREWPNNLPKKCIGDFLDIDRVAIPVKLADGRKCDPFLFVNEASITSSCFTKAYARPGRSGSLLEQGGHVTYFTPTEIARLHCFPDLVFPPFITRDQMWKLIGNSVNVLVIGHVLCRFLVEADA